MKFDVDVAFAMLGFAVVALLVLAGIATYSYNLKAEHCRASGMVPVQYNGSVYCASIESLKVPK